MLDTVTGRLMASSSRSVRDANIDRIRGVAIGVVILLHYAMFGNLRFWPFETHIGSTIAAHGIYGVTIFFVISGFLITSISLRRWGELADIEVAAFYQMRAARILPGLLLLISLLLLFHVIGVPHFVVPDHRNLGEAVWLALTFRYHWVLAPNAVEGMIGFGPIWSLSVEELFYIFFPIAVTVLRTRSALIAALCVVIVSGPNLREVYGLYNLPASVDALAMGSLTALIADRLALGRLHATFLQIAGLGLGAAAYMRTTDANFHIYTPSFIELGIALFLLGSVSNVRSLGSKFWPDRLLRFLGSHSYELYLFHIPILLLLKSVPLSAIGLTPPIIAAVYLIALAAFSALVSRYYVEPLNRYLRSMKFNSLARLSTRDAGELSATHEISANTKP